MCFFKVVVRIEPKALLILQKCAQSLSYNPSSEYSNL